jgi:nucleotide-binding universal stress UspA family protein
MPDMSNTVRAADVMTAREGFEMGNDGPSAIVVGVDGSDTSMRAAYYAAGTARREHTRLVVVYAREPGGGLTAMMDSTGNAHAVAIRAQEEIEAHLRDALGQARAEGVAAELVVRAGDPLNVLSDVAREVRADHVVVGSSASLGHRIAGSLAIRLVRLARWPVTVVP